MSTIKIFRKLLLLFTIILAVGCENTIDAPPAPKFRENSDTADLTVEFGNSIGVFKVKSISGDVKWNYWKNRCFTINGNDNGANQPNEDWLITSKLTLPGEVASQLFFDYIAKNFTDISSEIKIMISENYNPKIDGVNGSWTELNPIEKLANNIDWNLINTGEISLKSFKGKSVYLAIKYLSTTESAGMLLLKNFEVKDRKPVLVPYSEMFDTSKGKFNAISIEGPQVWAIDYSYIKMSGFVSSSNIANQDWLISPQIDLSKVAKARMSFDYVTRYFGTLKNEATVWISRDYEGGLPSSATWTQIKTPLPLTDKGSWDFSKSGEVNLSEYAGDTITIAFKYLSTTKAGTWEIKNFSVQEGEPADFLFVEAFDATLGKFTTDNKSGAQNWYVNTTSQYAVMSGYANYKSNSNEDWLISPTIDLTGKTSAKINFDHTINKGLVTNVMTNHTLWLSNDNGTTWEQIAITTYPTGKDWNFVNSGDIVIPPKYLGISTFRFAFKYLCSDAESASWEIRNVVVKP